MEFNLTCPCGRKMTPEAVHYHMADCSAIPIEVQELSRALHDALVTDENTYQRLCRQITALAGVPWYRRFGWRVQAVASYVGDLINR